jgi:hypothetical protein
LRRRGDDKHSRELLESAARGFAELGMAREASDTPKLVAALAAV